MPFGGQSWAIIPLVVALYCFVQGVLDARRKRYAMAAIGQACGLVILLTPLQTHAIKLDLIPMPTAGR